MSRNLHNQRSLVKYSGRAALIEAVEAAYEYLTDHWVALGTDKSKAQAERCRKAFSQFDFGAANSHPRGDE